MSIEMLELTICLSSAEQCDAATSHDSPAFLTDTRRIIKDFSILLYPLGAVTEFVRVCIFVNFVFAFILFVLG